ncbi:hypothetical protein [Lactococcus fujiensis]|uniref:Uncharacterized protein n=2 Tax=Lactococcus fujiensis TaxID=610251 RepID=A0A2A5RNR2_9LACT|nr:hypothetical protein [Lactococcus fujiensis]PCS00996.1 hypothetical protein RT41_GL000786 [Lactococcus fujiensis JCM 16395]
MYSIILDTTISATEKVLFVKTKSDIEFGRSFDQELKALLNELTFIPNSSKIVEFKEEVRKRALII